MKISIPHLTLEHVAAKVIGSRVHSLAQGGGTFFVGSFPDDDNTPALVKAPTTATHQPIGAKEAVRMGDTIFFVVEEAQARRVRSAVRIGDTVYIPFWMVR